MKQKRRLVSVIRKQLHPPVSKMTRLKICQYIYGTTKEMNVDWTPYFEHAVQRKRIPKGCYKMPGPGSADYVEPAKKTKKKGALSEYNRFVQSKMHDKSLWEKHLNITHTQKMREIAKLWKKQKTDKADAGHEKAVRIEDAVASARAMKKMPKIPKKKKA